MIPNFLPGSAFAERSAADAGQYALYAGRLAEEKGVDTAIEAAKHSGVPLSIAGEGPDEPRLRRLAAQADADIRFLGQLDGPGLASARAGAALAVLPSRWHEPHPYAVSESMAAGLPVLVSPSRRAAGDGRRGLDRGAGRRRAPGPRRSGSCGADPALRRDRGEQALARARELFGEDGYYERLMACYRAALS